MTSRLCWYISGILGTILADCGALLSVNTLHMSPPAVGKSVGLGETASRGRPRGLGGKRLLCLRTAGEKRVFEVPDCTVLRT